MNMPDTNWLELVVALIVGWLLVVSIPQLKSYFDQLVGAIISAISLGIVVAIVIFAGWLIMNKMQ